MDKDKQKVNTDAAVENYPGVAVNIADNDKDTAKLVKERTETLNNNPRDNDL